MSVEQKEPKMITEEYKALLKETHADESWGTTAHKYVNQVYNFYKELGAESILDYGAGKGALARDSNLPIAEYDPAIPGKDSPPKPADLVVCIDVLEHIEPECIDSVIEDLYRLSKKGLYLVIACYPAQKILPDGRNAHLIVKDPEWWLSKLPGCQDWKYTDRTLVVSIDKSKPATPVFQGRYILDKLVQDYEFKTISSTKPFSDTEIEVLRSLGKETDVEYPVDCTWCYNTLQYEEEPIETLRNLHLWLKPGGVLAVTVSKEKNISGSLHNYNAGLLLYHLVLAGFNCRDATVRTHGNDIVVLVKRPEVDLTLPSTKLNIDLISQYLPEGYNYSGFKGDIESINWPSLMLYGKKNRDFLNTAVNKSIILCGGHPSLKEQMDYINFSSMIPVASMNNTGTLIDSDIWFGMDRPSNYSESILQDPSILKIGRLNYPNDIVAGRKWIDQPNTYFISDIGTETGDWLQDGSLIWFKDTFKVALQILYRLGYRNVFLAGCGFNQPGDYAYGENPKVEKQNKRLYSQTVEWLRKNQLYFLTKGFHIVNCTPGSEATFLPQMELIDVLRHSVN
jgi:SAM-dependent methyltransferase